MKNNGVKRKSVIASAFRSFSDWLYTMASGGVFGKIFTSYSKVNSAFKRSAVVSFVGNGSPVATVIRRLRFRISALFEQSAFLYLWRKIVSFLIGCRMRFFGSFTFVFGVYTGLVYLLKRYAFSSNRADSIYLVAAALLIVISLPLLASRKTLAETLLESRTGHFLITDFFGIPAEKLDVDPSRRGDEYNIAIIAGIVVGSLTYIISPFDLILVALACIVAALVLSNPEIGVVITALILPFLKYFGSDAMYFLVALYSLGYFIKLLRGKRILRVDIYDFMLLFLGVVLLFGGLVSVGGTSSEEQAKSMLALIVGSFVALNLLRTEKWVKRCAAAVFASGFFVSVLLLWQFVAGYINVGVDLSVLSLVGADPFFESREALSTYLLIVFGVAISLMSSFAKGKTKFIAWLGSLCAFGAIVTVGCKSAIVGAIVAVLFYFITTKRRTVTVMLLTGAGAVYAGFMFPAHFVEGILSGVESLAFYFWRAVSVWQGTFSIIVASLFGGIGIGTFSSVYPKFSLPGSEKASETSSLALRILCDVGAVGLIAFAVVLFLFLQHCFEYIKNTSDKSKLTVAGVMCAVIGVLFQSLFFDVWSDMSVFYLFWITSALAVARIRIGENEAEIESMVTVQSESRASVDLF